jgi:hypothetical protein
MDECKGIRKYEKELRCATEYIRIFFCFWCEIKGFAATHPCAARIRLFRLINTRNGALSAQPPIAASLLLSSVHDLLLTSVVYFEET